MEGTYKANVFCTNCEFRGEHEITKGTTIEDTLCPNCGNATLEKDLNAHLGGGGSKPNLYI